MLIAGWPIAVQAQLDDRPNPEVLRASYQRGDDLQGAREAALKLSLTPRWIEGSAAFWYRNALADGKKEFWRVDSATGRRERPFDAKRLAEALAKGAAKPVDPEKLPFDEFDYGDAQKSIRFRFDGKLWDLDLASYALTGGPIPPAATPPPGRNPSRSPNGNWVFRIEDGKLRVSGNEDRTVTVYECPIESVAAAHWSPDSAKLVVFKLLPGDRKPVYLIRSSPAIGSRGELVQRLYDQPGDRLDSFETFIADPFMKREIKSDLPPIWTGGQPWAGPPGIEWLGEGEEFEIDYAERGYGRFFVDAVSMATGKRRSIVDEDPDTFFDTTAQQMRILRRSQEMIWRSERDGFGRLYLIDTRTGAVRNPITPAGWVVRSIENLDETSRRITFTANLTRAGEDPYFIHAFSVDLDGGKLVRLTDGPGTHRLQISPDRRYAIDTWSRVDAPPVHELRRLDTGQKVAEIDRADLAAWQKFKLSMPEPFVAKGRDGKTDIWGLVHRPSTFDPKKKYPVVESIYAGPHDAHVPKGFNPLPGVQRLAELGFIVVQIDGMGTRNRGKAFHDVCYKNIADAGFPDRIAWMKALAQKYTYIDIERVGIYGTSAGGQSSTGALLFHPDFYKVAVSSCGCHDNRIDKFWWNEQWMGPMGPHYEAQSNITNAKNLKGNLMLIVGELDRNVPPESTFRLADALIKARKEFELVVIPGADHTDGGTYGNRKRMDFFVRHLLGVQTPSWNEEPAPKSDGIPPLP